MTKVCKYCEIEFDLDSQHKKKVGGRINECPDCVEDLQTETAVKYLGLHHGEGEANALKIVAFKSEEDKISFSADMDDSTTQNNMK